MAGLGDIFGCVAIKAHCGKCDQRPVAVASVPASPTEMDLLWACDDHIGEMAAVIHEHDLSTQCQRT